MAQAALVVFAKTLGLSQVKTRLQKDLGKEATEKLYESFCDCTRAVIDEVVREYKGSIHKYWAVPEIEALSAAPAPSWAKIWQGPGDSLGPKLSHVYSELIRIHDSVIFIGADAPHTPKSFIFEGLKNFHLSHKEFIFGPAVDGGFYLFGGKVPLSEKTWTSVTYSKEDTCDQLRRSILAVGGRFAPDLTPMEDIDTIEELQRSLDFFQNKSDAMLPVQLTLAADIQKALAASRTVST